MGWHARAAPGKLQGILEEAWWKLQGSLEEVGVGGWWVVVVVVGGGWWWWVVCGNKQSLKQNLLVKLFYWPDASVLG